MRRRFVFNAIFVICTLWSCGCGAQPEVEQVLPPTENHPPTPEDSLLQLKLKVASNAPHLAAATLAVAKSWLGAPYVHGTLEKSDSEKLVVNLSQFDCWTFVEASLAAGLAAADSQPSMERYQFYLQQLRYRNGIIDGYGSRLHYFSEWLFQADSLGYVKDITCELGGRSHSKRISYMTDMSGFYPKLRDTVQRKQVETAQNRISARSTCFIPKAKVAAIEHLLKDGDIIILTSSRRNLDVEHQGFAVWGADGHVHLLHASSTGKKVIQGTRTLHHYLERLPAMSGIVVARIR